MLNDIHRMIELVYVWSKTSVRCGVSGIKRS
jgi:hypothetical protein